MSQIFKIISFTGKFWKWYFFMGIFIISVSLLSLVGPILIKQIVDIIVGQVTGKQVDIQQVIFYLVLIISSDFAVTLLTTFSQWIGDILAVRLHTHLTGIFYRHLLDLD